MQVHITLGSFSSVYRLTDLLFVLGTNLRRRIEFYPPKSHASHKLLKDCVGINMNNLNVENIGL